MAMDVAENVVVKYWRESIDQRRSCKTIDTMPLYGDSVPNKRQLKR